MNIAKLIDHTALKPDTKQAAIDALVAEAKAHGFCSVCVNPTWVAHCAQALAGTDVKVCTVIGFPLGANTTAVKVFETKDAIANGATEIDMVINIGLLKDGQHEAVEDEIRAIAEACHEKGALLKVIIETCLLTDAEKEVACKLSKSAGADFVKTSTGFSTGGATAADIALMRKVVGPEMGVKASGGVRTKEDAQTMVEAGASRIGASASVDIVK